MLSSTGFVAQSEVARRVSEIERTFSGHVLRIRYSIGADWSNEPAIFFRIILSDEDSREEGLRAITSVISDRLADGVGDAEMGLRRYFNFRSESEQESLKDPAWAA
jgi:hypothetical protein